MKHTVVAVSGTPASGKTTLCKRLGHAMDAKVMDLNSIIKKERLHSGYDRKMKARIVDVDVLGKHVSKAVEGDTILDGLLSHHLGATHIVVLRCDPRVLARRMEKRGYSAGKIM